MMTVLLVVFLITIFFLYSKRKTSEKIEYVYINSKTKKYHFKECPYAKDLKAISLEEAIKNNYIPCKICNNK